VRPNWLLALLFSTALAVTALLAGCGSGENPRFDALPGPLSTLDLAIAAADEAAPLSADEWASLESMHDHYLTDFDRLRVEAIAPLVREVRAREESEWVGDIETLGRFARKHAAVLGRIKALDDRFTADVSEAFQTRAAFVDRVTSRRAIDRSTRIIQGLSNGDDRTPTVLDLEPSVRALGLNAAERAAVEPALAEYRRDLARAAEQLAAAQVALPASKLAALKSAGVSAETVKQLAAHAKESDAARDAHNQAAEALSAAERVGMRPIARAFSQVDEANRRGLAAIAAALPPESGARLTADDERRRTSNDPYIEGGRFMLDVYARHPLVRSGRASQTRNAVEDARTALAAVSRLKIQNERARLNAADQGEALADDGTKARLEAEQTKAVALFKKLRAAAEREIDDGTQALLDKSIGTTSDEMRELLTPMLGAGNADRVVRAAGRGIFRSSRERTEVPWNTDHSIAEQLLLAPGMDHAAFHLAARAVGAKDDDPLVEQIWDRHQARVDALMVRQREQMRALEAKSSEAANRATEDPTGFERSLGDYLQSLLAADGERRQADDETFREVAIAIGLSEDDGRFVLARAVSASRRASLPWQRFRQAWLLGPLWESDADPISAALVFENEVERNAALVLLTAHAERLRTSADEARRVGLEALRDFLLFGVRAKRDGKDGSPESFRNAPEVRGIVTRVHQAGKARRQSQRDAIASIATMDQALGERLTAAWLNATFPQFFAEGQARRDAADLADAGSPPTASDAATAVLDGGIDRWKIVDQDMIRRLTDWQDARRETPAPSDGTELVTAAATDPELAALRTLRDENAWRLLRMAASAQGQAPDARMRNDDGAGAVPRPATWAP
jgi:hypothetical protein